ncbi:unnamed protein product, partial [Mesorhabditis spiculigera]
MVVEEWLRDEREIHHVEAGRFRYPVEAPMPAYFDQYPCMTMEEDSSTYFRIVRADGAVLIARLSDTMCYVAISDVEHIQFDDADAVFNEDIIEFANGNEDFYDGDDHDEDDDADEEEDHLVDDGDKGSNDDEDTDAVADGDNK